MSRRVAGDWDDLVAGGLFVVYGIFCVGVAAALLYAAVWVLHTLWRLT